MKTKYPKKIKKIGRPLKMTIKARKDAANTAMSKYVRLKAVKDWPDMFGDIPCYTCGVWKRWDDGMQLGHGIGGRNNAVLYMEEVCKIQCERCNGYLRGNYKVFTLKLIKELGAERYEQLLIESDKTVKMTPMQFLEIEGKYKQKLEEL